MACSALWGSQLACSAFVRGFGISAEITPQQCRRACKRPCAQSKWHKLCILRGHPVLLRMGHTSTLVTHCGTKSSEHIMLLSVGLPSCSSPVFAVPATTEDFFKFKLCSELFDETSLASGGTHTTWPGNVKSWSDALAAIQQLPDAMRSSSSSSTIQGAFRILQGEDEMHREFRGNKEIIVSRTSGCVLTAVSSFARGLPHFDVMADVAWEPLAKTVPVSRPTSPAAAVAAPAAGKQQACQAAAAPAAPAGKQLMSQAAAAAMPVMSPPSEAAAALQHSKGTPTAGTDTSPGGVPAKRPAEAEATPPGNERPKSASTQQDSGGPSYVDYALRDSKGRDYLSVELKRPSHLTLKHSDPVPDLVEVYNSHQTPSTPLLASTCVML